MHRPSTASLLALCIVLGACGGANTNGTELDSSGADATAADRAQDTSAGPATADRHDAAATHGHAAAPGEGVPLLAIMQKLGADIMTLTYALMSEDNEQVANSAHDMAEHAPIAAEDVERIHQELGAEMTEFERLDEQVHRASVSLHEAAAAGQMDVVLERLGEVQRGCIQCHSQFRERLRTTTAQ